jgi:hypothetical protein
VWILRHPSRLVLLWTILCGVAVSFLVPLVTTPAHPECRDMCGMGTAIGSYLIGIIVVIWLVVSTAAIAAWHWFGHDDRGGGG